MKKCCQTGDEQPSATKRIYNYLVVILLVSLVLGILYQVIFN